MFNIINEIHKSTHKSRIYLFFDVIICGLKYQAGYVDYYIFEMWNLNSKERKTILTRGKNNIFVKYYNKKEFNHIVLELAHKNNIQMDEKELLLEANKWELSHGGLSGRTAQQFIDYLLGKQ